MRSSKSRSRNKSNRQRSIGNIINRVFDSSGPEGKVRGTPQQIIEKYLALARDAQLGNDRVAEQNFLQHAEHYTRMLGEAQREMAREQEERQRTYQQNGQGGAQNGNQNGGRNHQDRAERDSEARFEDAAPMTEAVEDDGPGLVDTPETQPEAAEQPAAPQAPVAEERAQEFGLPEAIETAPEAPVASEAPAASDADEAARPRPRTRRGPRKPRAPKGEEAAAEASSDASGE